MIKSNRSLGRKLQFDDDDSDADAEGDKSDEQNLFAIAQFDDDDDGGNGDDKSGDQTLSAQVDQV